MAPTRREDVLKWYSTLGETLRKLDIDINNPRDLMRVQVVTHIDEEKKPGSIEHSYAKFNYAFMRRGLDQLGKRTVYENPEPLPTPDEQDSIQEELQKVNDTAYGVSDAAEALDEAREQKKSFQEIQELREKLDQAQIENAEASRALTQKMNTLLGPSDRWKITNSEHFNPENEEDYKYIEDLYNAAMEGRLFAKGMNPDAHSKNQILVGLDNTSHLSKDVFEIDKSVIDPYGGVSADITKAKLDPNFHPEFPGLMEYQTVPERPKMPNPVPKPSGFSWFKRIITLGIVNGDFKRYDKYQKDCTRVQHEQEIYDQNLPKIRAAVAEKNRQIVASYDEALKQKYQGIVPNVANPVRVMGNMMFIERLENMANLNLSEDNPIQNDSFEIQYRLHSNELRLEAHESPASFDKSGNRVPGESKKYWEAKGEIDAESKHEALKADKKEIKAEMRDLANREKVEARKENVAAANALGRKNAEIGSLKQQIELLTPEERQAIEKPNWWMKYNLEEVMTEIGKLYGKDKEYGAKMFMACILDNQPRDKFGDFKELEESFTDAQVAENLQNLIKIAVNGPKPNDPLLESLVWPLELRANNSTDFSPSLVVDSVSSLLATNMSYQGNVRGMKIGLAYAANMMDKLVTTQDIDLDGPLAVNNGDDCSISGPEERSFAMGVCKDVAHFQSTFKFGMDVKAQLAEAKQELGKKPEPEVQDLDLKHPMNLGL